MQICFANLREQERERIETKRHTHRERGREGEREREREREREGGFKITIWPFRTLSISHHKRFEHIFLALIVFPYSHNKKDIHWHPQQHSIFRQIPYTYTVHAMHNEKPPSEDFGTCFSSGLVVISLLVVVLFLFFLLDGSCSVQTVLYEVCGTYDSRMAQHRTDKKQ